MFFSDRVRVEVSSAAAQARLVNWARRVSLLDASRRAYDDGLALVRVGPGGAAPGLSRVVEVQFEDPVTRENVMLLPLRWEVTGPGGSLFPVLDAHLTLAPDGDEATRLQLDGSYRPPLGALGAVLDRAVMHRVAAATITSFLEHVASVLAPPETAPAPAHRPARDHAPWPSPGPEMT